MIKTKDQIIESTNLILATGCKPKTIGETKFSDLMRIRLNGKTKRHMEI